MRVLKPARIGRLKQGLPVYALTSDRRSGGALIRKPMTGE